MSLGLKLYYLRTRERQITQATMARELRVRQATISNLEQDISRPSLELLLALCRYFDVTPTWLLDDEGPLEPQASDRWSNRNGLTTTGQYLEVEARALHPLPGERFLVAMLPGTPILDEEAARIRATDGEDLESKLEVEQQRRRRQNRELRRELERERTTKRLRRRGVSDVKAESMLREQGA